MGGSARIRRLGVPFLYADLRFAFTFRVARIRLGDLRSTICVYVLRLRSTVYVYVLRCTPTAYDFLRFTSTL